MSDHFVLKLFIAGPTPAARRAIANLKEICQQHMGDRRYDLQIIDIVEQPHLAEEEKILATPIVIKQLPPPMRRIIGDLSDHEHALVGLGLVST